MKRKTAIPRTKPEDESQQLELEAFLPYRLSVLSNRISQAIAKQYAERFDLSVTEWRVIAVLGRFASLSANEVAEKTAMDKVQVSRAVARLQATGRLKRDTHGDDKRRSVLALTAAGRKIFQQVAPLALQYERHLLDALSNEDRTHLDRILRNLNVHLSDNARA